MYRAVARLQAQPIQASFYQPAAFGLSALSRPIKWMFLKRHLEKN